jgi:tetratricopeptide (TPR) repeat protein
MAREVLSIRRERIGPEDPLVATTLCDVAWAAGGQNKLEEAEALEREALAMRQKLLSPKDPDVAKSLYLVGDRLRQRRLFDAALPYLNQALAIEREVLGEDHPAALDAMHSLGQLFEEQGQLTQAEEVDRQALQLWRKRGESEIPQALSALASLTHVLIREKKFGDAEQILDEVLTPDLMRLPSSAEFLKLVVDLKSRRGEWQQAAADASLAFDHQPSDHSMYSLWAALLIRTDDLHAYQDLCRRIFADHSQTTDPYVADQVAKACLLRPSSGLDLQTLGRLADLAVTRGAGDAGALPFFQLCKALSEYRLGHFAEAVAWAQKTYVSSATSAHAQACGVLAMAYWRQGEKDVARAMLAKGDTLAPPVLPASVAEDPGDGWHAWLYARTFLDEAAALIQLPSTTGNGSNKP